MKARTKKTYSVVDLFAGAGGLSYGFLQTGRFEISAAFENNPNAQKTYKYNHPNATIYGDVSEVLTADIGKVDVVIGGPPCQGFSNANRQKNHVVSQNNSLVKKYIQAVLHLNPMAFIMENVSMLQSKTHRFYVDANDFAILKEYEVKTEDANIHLLDTDFLFDGVSDVVADAGKIGSYLWENENDYLSLSILYRYRKNPEKLMISLNKHKSRLLNLAKRLANKHVEHDYVVNEENLAGKAIINYYANQSFINLTLLCKAIEPTIMLQRMFSKAKEIIDNNIVVSKFSTEHGLIAMVKSMSIIDYIESILGASSNGYIMTKGVLSAINFGVPQKRMRFVIMGLKKTLSANVHLPEGMYSGTNSYTVHDAISDIENIAVSTETADGEKGVQLASVPVAMSQLGKMLRNTKILYNHISTDTTPEALERFKVIKQGNNFHSLDDKLKTNYSDPTRTQNTIYLRLNYNEPSGTVVNVRKSMWIHPTLNRALSIREAARLQTFPDSFIFFGTKDSQYQQVGNAVPPALAKYLANHLCEYLDGKKAVINYLEEHGSAITAEFASFFGIDCVRARTLLRKLVNDGVVNKIGKCRYTSYVLAKT